jgi:drug/metabolite transporter (DMT)-like permease
MSRAYWPLLLFLSAIWGASYLFIKVAVRDFDPATAMFLRVLVASTILVGFLFATRGVGRSLAELRAAWLPGLVLGVLNAALPFTLIAWGEKHIDSGVAAIANASVPIFNALIVFFVFPHDRVAGSRLVGIALGLVGVGVLTGIHPEGDSLAVVATLAVVLASFSYASAGVYGQRRVTSVSGPVLATSSMIFATLVLLPLAALNVPTEAPGWKSVGSVLALAVLGTALAQLVLFRMLRLFGASRLSLVTYLLPVTALIYGSLLLDEPLNAGMLGGLALILAGVALGSGAVRLPRRRVAAHQTP